MQSQTFIALRSTGYVFAQQMIWHVLKMVLIMVMVSLGSLVFFSAGNVAALAHLLLAAYFSLEKLNLVIYRSPP